MKIARTLEKKKKIGSMHLRETRKGFWQEILTFREDFSSGGSLSLDYPEVTTPPTIRLMVFDPDLVVPRLIPLKI